MSRKQLTTEQSEAIVQLVISMQVVLEKVDDIEGLGLSVQATKMNTNRYLKFIEKEYGFMINDLYNVQENTYQNLTEFRSKIIKKIYSMGLQDEIPVSNLVLKYKNQSERFRNDTELTDFSARDKELID